MEISTQKLEQPQRYSFIEYLIEEVFGYVKIGIDFLKELHKPDDK